MFRCIAPFCRCWIFWESIALYQLLHSTTDLTISPPHTHTQRQCLDDRGGTTAYHTVVWWSGSSWRAGVRLRTCRRRPYIRSSASDARRCSPCVVSIGAKMRKHQPDDNQSNRMGCVWVYGRVKHVLLFSPYSVRSKGSNKIYKKWVPLLSRARC